MAAAADTVVKASKSPSIPLLLLRLAVSLVFAFAAVGKLFDLADFQRSLAAIEWMPSSVIFPTAILLILAEISAAILLLPRSTLKAGAALSAVLSLAFLVYTAQRLLVGASTDCACFGIFLKLNPWAMLPIDFALLITSLAVLQLARVSAIPKSVPQVDSASPSLRLPVLIGSLLLCLWGFFRILPYDPVLNYKIENIIDFNRSVMTYNPITPAMLKHDPAIGTNLPIPKISGLDVQKPTFIVFTTNCSICSFAGLSPAEKAARAHGDNMIIVSPTPLSHMRDFISEQHLRAIPVSDLSNKYDFTYNLTFKPRTYLLDREGRLVWKQITVKPDEAELEKAALVPNEEISDAIKARF